MNKVVAAVIALALVLPAGVRCQVTPDVWRGFVEKIDIGTELTVRLEDGARFRAVLVGVRPDAVLLQPRTRVPVPVQPVPYDAIVSLERRQNGGIGAAKAAAIGVASGVGAFFATMLIIFVVVND
jgi:hypothetical protein